MLAAQNANDDVHQNNDSYGSQTKRGYISILQRGCMYYKTKKQQNRSKGALDVRF